MGSEARAPDTKKVETPEAPGKGAEEEYWFKVDKEFLEKSLKKKVRSFEVTTGSNPGDNYLSILFAIRVDLEGESKPLHLMLKTFPSHQARHAMLQHFNVFANEVKVYGELLPQMMQWQRSVGLPPGQELQLPFPPYIDGYAVDYSKTGAAKEKADNFLLMVNVKKTYGFDMEDRLLGLDLEHSKAVLNELARFHAVGWGWRLSFERTAKSRKEFLAKFPLFQAGFFHTHNDAIIGAVAEANSVPVLAVLEEMLADKNPGLMKSVRQFFSPGFVKKMYTYMEPDGEGLNEEELEGMMRVKPTTPIQCKEPWNILLHGDCWLNNFLFRRDPQTRQLETILVDLQALDFGDPTIDLTNFLYTSVDGKMRKEHINELLEHYASKFIGYCRVLGIKPMGGFTPESLKRRFNRTKILGLIFAIVYLPIILTEREDTLNLDKSERKEGSNDMDFLKDNVAGKVAKKESMLARRMSEIVTELYEDGII